MRFGVATTVLLATGALLVAACGGDAGSTSDGPPAAPPAPEQTEPETPRDQAPAGGRTGAAPTLAPPAREQTEPETPQEIDQAPAGGRTGAEPVGDAGSTSDGPPAAPPAPEQPEPETPQEIDQAPAGCRTGAEPVGDGSAPVPDAQEGRRGGVGVITTVAGLVPQGPQGDGGPATAARLDFPVGVALDGAGNLFIADASNGRVRRVDTVTGIITTVAGTGEQGFGGDGGPATAAQLAGPVGVALDGAGNLFIADSDNSRVRRVDAATGVITTVAGGGEGGFRGDGGPATAARLWSPSGVTLDGAGNLFIADWSNHRVRRVDAASGVITTVAGTGADGSQVSDGDGGPATAALLAFPESVALDGAGNLFIADTRNHRVRRVDAATGVITAVAGTIGAGFGGDGGPATAALLAFPRGVALDGAGNLFIADSSNDRVRRVDAASGVITTVAGTGKDGSQVSDGDGGPATAALLASPESVALDGAGNLFIADLGNSRVRRVDAATGVITTVAGAGAAGFGGDGGPATAALLAFPNGVALDGAGNLFIADSSNDRVRRVDAATGVITTVAGTGVEGFSGDGGPATAARLWGPRGVALDEAGDLFIADADNNRVRRVAGVAVPVTNWPGIGPGR